jgi:hypothetical protein
MVTLPVGGWVGRRVHNPYVTFTKASEINGLFRTSQATFEEFTLQVEVARSYHITTQSNNPEDRALNLHRHEDPKSRNI